MNRILNLPRVRIFYVIQNRNDTHQQISYAYKCVSTIKQQNKHTHTHLIGGKKRTKICVEIKYIIKKKMQINIVANTRDK